MTLSLSILVPYRPDGAWRDRAWGDVVAPYLSRVVEEWPVDAELLVESPPPTGPGHPGDFNHPLAINTAASVASGDLFAICDADCLPDPSLLRLADEAIRAGAQWVLPRYYRKLTQAATEVALARRSRAALGASTEWVGDSVSWAGCPVIPAAAFRDVGGYDERIAWWGADDVAFGLTMTTLYGEAMRLAGVTHFWHSDPLEHNYGHERHASQQALVNAYIRAAGRPDEIRKLRFG